MAATFAVTDPEVTDSLARSLGNANRVLVEEQPLLTLDLLTYSAEENNWINYPIVYVNGVTVSSGFTTSVNDGSITFSNARAATDVVVATYWFEPYTIDDLEALCTDALYALEGKIGVTFDETAFPRKLKEPVVATAHVMAMRGLQASTAEYYKWQIDGRLVDKSGVTSRFDKVIRQQMKYVDETLVWVRPQYMAEGINVHLNIDIGRPPNRYSRYRPEGWP